MNSVVAAWGTYASAIGTIYFVGQEAGEILPKDDIAHFAADHPVTRIFNSTIETGIEVADNLLCFHQHHEFPTPAFFRSAVFSVIAFALLIFPLHNYLQYNLLFMPGGINILDAFLGMVLSHDFTGIGMPVFFTSIFIAIAILSDYISFSKTRFIISKLRNQRPRVILGMMSIDVVLSIVLGFIVSATIAGGLLSSLILLTSPLWLLLVWGFVLCLSISLWKFGSVPIIISVIGTISLSFVVSGLVQGILGHNLDRWYVGISMVAMICTAGLLWKIYKLPKSVTIVGSYMCLLTVLTAITVLRVSQLNDTAMDVNLDLGPLYILVVASAMIPGPIVFAMATGLGIGVITVIIGMLETIRQAAGFLENTRVWKVLFEQSPTRGYAIIVIVLFTIVYWPAVIVWNMI